MGCNIHTYVEKLRNGSWVRVDPPMTKTDPSTLPDHLDKERWIKYNPYSGLGTLYCYTPQVLKAAYPDLTYKELENESISIVKWYLGIYYDLFAILAGVRNGSEFKPISFPKGLPNNVSHEVKKESDKWNGDGHNHSFLTLEEINNYDWSQVAISSAYFSEGQYKEYKETGKVIGYYAGVVGQTNLIVSNQKMDEIISGTSNREEILYPNNKNVLTKQFCKYYTLVEFPTPHVEVKRGLFGELLKEMEILSEGDPESVRIVFWFDN